MNTDIYIDRRADYMETRGSEAWWTFGPFSFYVRTTDGGNVGFSIAFGHWSWGWQFGRDDD